MTSLQHDNEIEIITLHANRPNYDDQPPKGYVRISSPSNGTSHFQTPGSYHLNSASSTSENKTSHFGIGNCDHVHVVSGEKEVPSDEQKRIGRVVMAVAGVLLLMCILLVGVTLTMSDHIDDKVRKANGLLTTNSTPRTNRSASYNEQNDYTES